MKFKNMKKITMAIMLTLFLGYHYMYRIRNVDSNLITIETESQKNMNDNKSGE